MEYLDFSSVITTIRNYISDAHSMNQIDMMYQLFVSFLSSDESLDFDFDNGLVCRWFMDKQKSVLVSPGIIWITTIETDSLLICTEMCFR